MEDIVTKGLRNYFSFIMGIYTRRIKMTNERSIYFVGISFFLLLVASFMTSFDLENIFLQTVNEGIFIGGWVFMWEAISSYSIKKREIKDRLRHYRRFFDSPIKFRPYDTG
jgi:hypothetical protein